VGPRGKAPVEGLETNCAINHTFSGTEQVLLSLIFKIHFPELNTAFNCDFVVNEYPTGGVGCAPFPENSRILIV